MPKLKPCNPRSHDDRPTGDIRYVKCVVCKDVFPCKTKCWHLDCCYVRGDALPAYWTSVLEAMGLGFSMEGLVKWSERKDVD